MIWMVDSWHVFEWLIAHRMAGWAQPTSGGLGPWAVHITKSTHLNAENVSLDMDDMAISHIASWSRYLSIWGSKRISTLTSAPLTAVFRLWWKFARSRCRQKSTCHDKPWPGGSARHSTELQGTKIREDHSTAMGNVFQIGEKVISHQFKMVQGFDGNMWEVQGGTRWPNMPN